MIAKKLLISAALLWGAVSSYACTSIIVSGKVTPDGRPYIFKNRDTHDQNNLAIQIQRPSPCSPLKGESRFRLPSLPLREI